MIDCLPDASWKTSRYRLVFSSAAAEAEWKAFSLANPEAAKRTYERLSAEPLTRVPRRQYPLKGAKLKPFWELEATGAFRVYYATNIQDMTVIIAARSDVHSGPDVGALIRSRRRSFDDEVRLLAESTERMIKEPQRVLKSKPRKKTKRR